MDYETLKNTLPEDMLIFVDYMLKEHDKFEIKENSIDGNKYKISLEKGLYTVSVIG